MNESLLVGMVALGLVGFIAARMVRGIRTGRLPIYRTYLDRDGNEGKFYTLLALHGASLVLIAVIATDLLFGLNLRDVK